jgi:DNA replication protein DnaC
MRLTAMADAFRNQLDDPKCKEIPFEDQFGMLVDIEYSSRKNNRLKRLIKNAGFDQPEANIMDINYTSGRKLNKELIRRLATCEYLNTGIFLLPVLQAVVRLTWPVPLAWRLVSSITIPSMSVFLICL